VTKIVVDGLAPTSCLQRAKTRCAVRAFSRQGGRRGDIAQACEPHDGLSGKFLRELHAALVVGTVGLVQIDIRQLFGAARAA